MKVLVSEPRARRRYVWAELILLLLLAGVAGYVWTAPQRAERALKNASLYELQTEARRNPNNARIHYYLGLRLQQAGQLPAAYDAFAQAAQLDADDEPSWLATAALAAQLYGDQGAFDLLNVYVKRHPESAQAHLALAQLYRANLSHKRAREEALAAAKYNPHLAEAWYVAGLSANSLNSPSEAEAALRHAVAEAPQDWRYQMVLGDVIAAQKRGPEAIACYQQAIRLAPKEGVPYLSLGKLQLEQAASPADIQAAQKNLLQSAALQPEIPLTYLLIGRSYIRQGRWTEAKEAMEHAERLAPADPDPVFDLVRIYRQLGDKADADSAVERHRRLRQFVQQKQALKEKAVTLKDQAPQLRLQLARLCAANGDNAEALEQYHRYLELQPHDAAAQQELARLDSRITSAAQASQPVLASATSAAPALTAANLLQQADALYAQKRYPDAERAYIRILQQDKSSGPACQGLGLTLAAEGQPDRALVFLLSAVKRDPNLAPAQFTLAQNYMAMDAPAEARRRLLIAVAREPGNAAYWHLLGLACGEAEPYYGQAEEALRHAVALDPHNVGYQLDLADGLVKTGKHSEAEATFRQALSLAPRDPETLSRAAMFLLSNQPDAARQQEAEQLLQKALAISPDDSYALYALGHLRLDRGDPRQAVGYLQRALKLATQTDTAELWYLLARAYQRLGNGKQAGKAMAISQQMRQDYEATRHTAELADKNPRDVGLRLKLARLYARRGANAPAIATYQTCLQLDPHNAPARSELAALETRLKASGKMPSMTTFHALVAAAGH